MKNKGFTLVELLAVIILLSIIALIAVPKVLEQKEKKEKEISEATKKVLYADAETYLKENNEDDITPGQSFCIGVETLINEGYISMDADDLKDETVKLTIDENGNFITSLSSNCSGAIKVGDKVKEKIKGTFVAAEANETHKGIIYMDPTDLSATCNKELSDANVDSTTSLPTGIKTGCMKFYIYDDSGDTYKMILDHNTTAKVAWVTKDDYLSAGGTEEDWNKFNRNSKGPLTVNAQLATDTAGWVGSPRLITAQEIADITNTTTFDGSTYTWFIFDGTETNKQTQASSTQGASPYKWLFDYTKGCESYGCNTADSSNYGYWASSPVSDASDGAWYVGRFGGLHGDNVNIGSSSGVRPVITLSKSQISS